MKKSLKLVLLLIPGILISCSDKDETNLKDGDRKFIQDLGILEPKEELELFECNGGFGGAGQSGNFITKRRIAAYWIEDGEKEVHSAFFENEIDSMSQTDNHTALTYASYVTVYKTDGTSFHVYVDADSTRVYEFFNKARSNWENLRRNK